MMFLSNIMGYTKLFSDIVASSLWDEDDNTRIVFITMLALKDKNHFVRGTLNWLAISARIKVDACEKALEKLSSPDPKSHSREHEGRRIQAVDGGWIVLNGEKYKRMLSKEERAEYQRDKQSEYRDRRKKLKHNAICDGARAAIADGFSDAAKKDTNHES